MNRREALIGVGVSMSAALSACHGDAAPTPQVETIDMNALKPDLERIAAARILFAHQSVGRNILQGVHRLAVAAGVPLHLELIEALPPIQGQGQRQGQGPGVFHLNIGQNGQPEGKVDAFVKLLTQAQPPNFDAAMLKFCYVDLEDADAARPAHLLEHYLKGVAQLQALRPDLRLVHATMPLRAQPSGWKTTVNRLLGRPAWGDTDHLRRNAYNAALLNALKQRDANAPVLDIAALESTHANGERSQFTVQAAPVYTLAPEYTDDGGHLNAAGQQRVAAAWISVFARALSH